MTRIDSQNVRPRVWLATHEFGLVSEVWMYRQASSMRRLDLTVITNRYLNEDRFPQKGFRVEQVRGRLRLPPWQPLRDMTLNVLAKRNRKARGFAKSAAETDWWLSQIDQNRPDVVLAQFGTTALELFPVFAMAGIPLVAHFHGFDLSRQLRNERYRRRLRESAGRLAAYVVVAEYMLDELLGFGVPANKIFKIPCGAPPALFSIPRHCNDESCRFLAVGRFVDKKRPDLTIRAFASAAEMETASTLTMIGDGPLLSECKKLVRALGVTSRVNFLGAQPQSRVREELARASVFVQHSTTAPNGDKEGWPVSIAEAAACGLPVVATKHASIPEQIPHGVAGLLCEEGDWKTMSEYLLKLAMNPIARRQMGIAAQENIRAMSTEIQIAKLEALLLEHALSNRAIGERASVA